MTNKVEYIKLKLKLRFYFKQFWRYLRATATSEPKTKSHASFSFVLDVGIPLTHYSK